MALHDNLKDVRNRVGMSQEFVADQLGISRQAVTKWELGQSKPNAKNLQALAELYHVSSEELLSNTQQKGPNLILRTNLTKWAIIFQSAFLYSCTQEIFQLRHPTKYPDKGFYRGALTFSLRACLKSFDKNGGVGDNRKKQAGAGENASIPK